MATIVATVKGGKRIEAPSIGGVIRKLGAHGRLVEPIKDLQQLLEQTGVATANLHTSDGMVVSCTIEHMRPQLPPRRASAH